MKKFRKKIRGLLRIIKSLVKKVITRGPKLKFYYAWFYKHCKIVENRMLIESFHGKNISDSPLAVLQELVGSGEASNYEIFYATDNMSRDKEYVQANGLPVKLVDISTRRYVWVLATSKYLLNNSSFPAYFIRRPEQNYVQTWHGTPLKTLGKQMRLGMESMYNVQHNFIQASYITFPNTFTHEVIFRDYNLNDLYTGKVAMVGYPRNSVFLRGENKELRSAYSLDGFQTFAYMPTWRGTNNYSVSIDSYKQELEGILSQLDNVLNDKQKLFVNFHSMVESQITLGSYKHIFPFPKTVGNYDFLSQIDVLITDYSSVFFDYALTKRPVILFAYDLEEYLRTRGLYFPIEDLPFPILRSTEELTSFISEGRFNNVAPGVKAFEEEYLPFDSVDNPKKVLDLLLERNLETITLQSYSHNAAREWNVLDSVGLPSAAKINGLFKSADPEKDIIIFPRTRFGPVRSAHIYDNYRDDCNYVFITRATPRTYLEEVLARFSSQTKENLKKREIQRVFGNLPIGDWRSSYCVIENGAVYSKKVAGKTLVNVSRMQGRLSIELTEPCGILEKVFFTKKNVIFWNRDATEEERTEGVIHINIDEFPGNMEARISRNCRIVFGASFINENGERIVKNFVEQEKALVNNKRDPSLARYLEPRVLKSTDFNRELLSEDPWYKNSLLFRAQGRDIALTPYFSNTGKLSLLATVVGDSAKSYCKAELISVRTPAQKKAYIKARLRVGPFSIVDVQLKNREESLGHEISVPYKVETNDDWHTLDISFDPNDYSFNGIYWDVVIVINEGYGYFSRIYVSTSLWYRRLSFIRNSQCVLTNGNVVFPYTAKGRKLAFIHRELYSSDSSFNRVKEFAAFFVFAILHVYWKRKRMWLVYEKFCSYAQDNAFAFFKYCMEEADPATKKFVYYVIDKNSPDYKNVEKYGKNVVEFMSFRHMLYCMVAKLYIASDSRAHLYQWRPKPSIIRNRISKHKIFFLQHGVTAMKRVGRFFGAKAGSPMTYFLTTSEREQEIVMHNLHYPMKRTPILGFSRWDLLKDKSNTKAPTIMLMPTWRTWLENQTDDVFLASDYYRNYSSLIKNPLLLKLLEDNNAELLFILHPKLTEFIKHFSSGSSRIAFASIDSSPINERLMEASMLITDYSSVAWDMLYMNKPVVFFQFDQDSYNNDIGSYIEFDQELPGALCKTESDCIAAIKSYLDNNFDLTQQDIERAKVFLPMNDTLNRQRTFDYIISKGF